MSSSSSSMLTISGIKVISTCGLGLLAGYSLAIPTLVVPTISNLSTKVTAGPISSTQRTAGRVGSGVAATVSLMLSGVYVTADKSGRHPYLLYAGILAFSGAVLSETILANQVVRIKAVTEGDVNGESVSLEFERMRQYAYLVAGIFTTAFGVAVVGNYGDFY